MTTQNQIEKTNIASSGANNDITSMTGLTGILQAPTGIKSSAGLNLATFNYVASAVNYLTLTNSATGTSPSLGATGTDSSVNLQFLNKNGAFGFSDSTATVSAILFLFNAASTHGTGLTVASGQSTNVTFTLPAADGATSGCALITNASTVLSFSANPVLTKINTQTITATGAFSYTPTTGTKYAIFEVQAAGGGSGGSTGAGAQSAVGGSGGGGGYLKILVNSVTNLAAITGTVGAGGGAGTSGNNAGSPGTSSTLVINSGTTWTAGGGGAGGGQAASASIQQSGSAGAGGTNTTGTNGTLIINQPGGNAQIGFSFAAAATTPINGAGGSSHFGGTGVGGGGTGQLYGGGATGTGNASGGSVGGSAGAQGIVVVTEFIFS